MIYLLGGTGYVGRAYQKHLDNLGIAYRLLSRQVHDYTDVDILRGLLEKDRPDFLINTAGYTGEPNVDACEAERAECLFGNAVLPGRIARACEDTGTAWGHISSGCIYTGTRPDGSGFTEEDPPNFTFRQNNCSFYSGTKALGEEVLSDRSNVYLWRLRIPFCNIDGKRNYLSKLMNYAYLLDAANSISQLDEFVVATINCWLRKVPYGIYNVTNPGQVTTREVVELIKSSGVCNKEYLFFDSEEDFMKRAAKTPRSNCVMNSEKLLSTGITMKPVRDAICDALQRWSKA